jgi:hypothetical protein
LLRFIQLKGLIEVLFSLRYPAKLKRANEYSLLPVNKKNHVTLKLIGLENKEILEMIKSEIQDQPGLKSGGEEKSADAEVITVRIISASCVLCSQLLVSYTGWV